MPSYKGYRYPSEVIAHCVWLYHRFSLSLRAHEELILERGGVVSYEAVRQWSLKFGPDYAAALRRRGPISGDEWHLDEVFIKAHDRQSYLWRAVGAATATCWTSWSLTAGKRPRPGGSSASSSEAPRPCPREIVTDKLRSYGAAHRTVTLSVEQRSSKYLNNRAEFSHLLTRQREYAMQGLRSVATAQRLLAMFSRISPHFRPPRHLMPATAYRTEMTRRCTTWNTITGTASMTLAA
ncbi:IS6 family transposase [Streptomyces sp. NPDC057743]|uniref:IS6 family transposase n=1 Tax=Streptomyces sp. NPDC057743 TaxID=3346236 RepID=UPI0036AD7384